MKKFVLVLFVLSFIAASCDSPAEEKTYSNQPQTEQFQYFEETEEENSDCDSNYSGCVPIASDVDCASGSGNGPAYTSGPVKVIGRDIYRLDRDGDGWGCE